MKKNLAMVDKEFILLGEGKSKTNEHVESGRTEGNKLVHFTCDEDCTGKLIKVKINEILNRESQVDKNHGYRLSILSIPVCKNKAYNL